MMERFFKDWLIPVSLGLVAFAAVVATLDDPGITWDESYPNIPAARNQADWIAGLFGKGDAAPLDGPFSQETIDKYWKTTSDHPSFVRTCAAFSYLLLHDLIGETASMRLPSAIWFGLMVTGISALAGHLKGRFAALVAGAAFLLMPRVFGHAHIFSLDTPICALWFFSGVSFAWSLHHPRRAPWAALVYALAFATKLHAVFLPPLFLALVVIAWFEKPEQRRDLAIGFGVWCISALVLLPIIYIGTQPWLWNNTVERLIERFGNYASKVSTHPIPVWFMRHKYGDDTPWIYPLVMTAITVPAITLLLSMIGLGTSVLSFRERTLWTWKALVLIGWAIPLGLVLLPLAQGYDGVRLFLPGFSYFAVMTGLGAETLSQQCLIHLERRGFSAIATRWKVLLGVAFVAAAIGPTAGMIRLHPCELSYYNALIGGLPGSQRLGFETAYWCDGLYPDFIKTVDDLIPSGASLRVLAMPNEVLMHYQERGLLKKDIRLGGEPPYDFHILQARQGMFNMNEWYFYRKGKPLAEVRRDGVLLYALYGPR